MKASECQRPKLAIWREAKSVALPILKEWVLKDLGSKFKEERSALRRLATNALEKGFLEDLWINKGPAWEPLKVKNWVIWLA